jgi:plasmid stabilization system protein ParE
VRQVTLRFAPEAVEHLSEIYSFIALAASPETARRFTDAVLAYCERLCAFPYRGRLREDIRPGLRLTTYRRRVAIAYIVDEKALTVIGVFYGGRDIGTGAAKWRS